MPRGTRKSQDIIFVCPVCGNDIVIPEEDWRYWEELNEANDDVDIDFEGYKEIVGALEELQALLEGIGVVQCQICESVWTYDQLEEDAVRKS